MSSVGLHLSPEKVEASDPDTGGAVEIRL